MMAEIGTILVDKYRIDKLIGKGGMSKVYLAYDIRLGKHWAVKEIEKFARSAINNNVVTRSAISEANIIKDLDNYYLPRINDILDDGKSIYIIMDYIKGESLKSILDREGAQRQEDVVKWGLQLCQALNYLHMRTPSIIYGDMKPGNVMIKPEGDIKLIDFGIAREFNNGIKNNTLSLGTRGYAAPEQFNSAVPSDVRTDIYNLGATLYHTATGHNPSKSPYKIRNIRELNPRLSSVFEQIVLKCTKPNPDFRYQNVREVYDALQSVYSDEGYGETTILTDTSKTLEYTQVASSVVAPGIKQVAIASVKPQNKVHNKKPLIIAASASTVAFLIILILILLSGPEPSNAKNLRSEPKGLSAISLTWDSSRKADGYQLEIRAKNPNILYDNLSKTPPETITDVGNETTYLVEGLICDEIYICTVKAYSNKNGHRIWQKGVGYPTEIKTSVPNLNIDSLEAVAEGYNTITAAWAPNDTGDIAQVYSLWVSNKANGDFTEVYKGDVAKFTKEGLSPNTEYFYKVLISAKIDNKEFSGESNVANATTDAFILDKPKLTAESTTYYSVNCSWSGVTVPAVTYVLYRSTKKDGGYKQVYSGKALKITDKGRDGEKIYYYKVMAIVKIGDDEYKQESDVISVKTKSAPKAQPAPPTYTPPPAKPTPNKPKPKPIPVVVP